LDLTIICCSAVAIVYYVLRMMATNDISDDILETGGNTYIKLQTVQMYDENFGYCVAIVFYAACVKLLQLLKFSRRLAMLIQTLNHSRPALINFTMMFLITYTAFCCVFYLLLGETIADYSTMLLTFQSAFGAMLGKFSYTDIVAANFLAPWFFFAFMVTQLWILINMLVGIVVDYLGDLRHDASKQPAGESELFDMLVHKAKRAVGMTVPIAKVKNMADHRRDLATLDQFNRRADMLTRKLNKQLGGQLDLKQLQREATVKNKLEKAIDMQTVADQRDARLRRDGRGSAP